MSWFVPARKLATCPSLFIIILYLYPAGIAYLNHTQDPRYRKVAEKRLFLTFEPLQHRKARGEAGMDAVN